MKTFHQIVSNLYAIAERFIVPTKYFFISLNFSQIVVFKEFMKEGGGE